MLLSGHFKGKQALILFPGKRLFVMMTISLTLNDPQDIHYFFQLTHGLV